MTLINKKGGGKSTKSSSKTPKPLESKRKISKKSQTDGIVDINKLRRDLSFKGKKASKKKNIISGNQKVISITEKEHAMNLKRMEMKQKNALNGEHSEKRQDSIRIREKPALLQKQQSNEMNKEMFGQLKKNEDSPGHNGNKKEKLGGLIFMCNEKTKADCFQYRVVGVPMSKKQIVLGVKPGLKLFLYDFDLRVMYGIYKASCSGGMKLESAAFNGAFPVQVRFNIDQDCYPLPESVFKRAIKENYTGIHRFKMELSVQQVKKLTALFRRAEVRSPTPAIIHPPPMMVAFQDREVTEGVRESGPSLHRGSLARDLPTYNEGRRYRVLSNEDDQHLTHTEVPPMARNVISPDYYPSESRVYGLGTGRQNFSPLAIPVQDRGINEGRRESHAHLHSETSAIDPHTYVESRSYHVRPMQRENLFQDYYPSEKEYRTYGLLSERQNTSPAKSCITPSLEPYSRDHVKEHPSSYSHLVTEKPFETNSLVPRRDLQSSTPFATSTITSTLDSYSKGTFYGYSKGGLGMESYPQPSSRAEVPLVSYSLSGRGETHPSVTDHWQTRDVYLSQSDQSRKGEAGYFTESNHLGRIEIKDTTYASSALSKYDRPEARTVTSHAPLSFLHSLAEPSLFNR